MKHKRIIIALVVSVLLGSGALLTNMWLRQNRTHTIVDDGKYIYLSGLVTAYDVTPSYSDGGIIFKIDDTSVDIGGGLRASNIIGEVYSPIHVGDKVEAKLISPEHGYLTVYDCSSCYVRKR